MLKLPVLLFALLFSMASFAQSALSLEAYRDSVYVNSTQLLDAAIEIDRASARERLAQVDFLPSLSASGSFTTDFRRSGGADLWGFTLQPRIEQVLYGGGGVRAAYRQAVVSSLCRLHIRPVPYLYTL